MAKRKRTIPLLFYVSEEERNMIRAKMEQYSTKNLSAYLRKMAIDGFVVNLELPELGEMVSLLRRSSNNLNQLTRRVHETGRFYDATRPIAVMGCGAKDSFCAGGNTVKAGENGKASPASFLS